MKFKIYKDGNGYYSAQWNTIGDRWADVTWNGHKVFTNDLNDIKRRIKSMVEDVKKAKRSENVKLFDTLYYNT